jgi:hypothetical protein
MAKRPTVEVDEDYLKEVMAGGASLPKREAQPVKEEEGEAAPQPSETREAARLRIAIPFPKGRRPAQADIYQCGFIRKDAPHNFDPREV